MFAPVNMPYHAGTTREMLKWKPPHLNSIDFLFQVANRTDGHTVADLYVLDRSGRLKLFTASANSSITVPTNKPASAQLLALNGCGRGAPVGPAWRRRLTRPRDSKIVECTWDPEKRRWKYLRTREDKTHPNNDEVAASA